jgi:anti-sigma factor RsiW
MTNWDDARLRAYLRGELGAAEMDAVDAALADDPHLADRLLQLAEADDDREDRVTEQVRFAFAPIEAMPVPAAMTAAVDRAEPGQSNVVDFAAAATARRLPRWGWPQVGAMAASLAIGVFVGQGIMAGRGAPATALVVASANGANVTAPVAAMLDKAASGTPQQLAGLGAGQVVITFRDGDGQLCRQFQIAGDAATTDAISCRVDGSWTVEALGVRAAAGDGMRTASGDAAPSVLAAVDAMIVGDVLVGRDEAAALAAR